MSYPLKFAGFGTKEDAQVTADSRWAERAEQADEQNGPGGRAGRWADWAWLAGGTGQIDGTIWQAGATWQPVLELRMTADSRRI